MRKGCGGAEVEMRRACLADQEVPIWCNQVGGPCLGREGADHLHLTALSEAAATLRLDPGAG